MSEDAAKVFFSGFLLVIALMIGFYMANKTMEERAVEKKALITEIEVICERVISENKSK